MNSTKNNHRSSNAVHAGGKSPVTFLTVTHDDSGQRIDNYLITRLKGMPKSHLYRLLRKGEVRVNKIRITPDYRLMGDDVIRLPPMQLTVKTAIKPSDSLITLLKSRILFENDHLMVINKPSGVPVHAGSTIKMGVIEAMKAAYPTLPHLELVHRLDTETSGCLMLAKKKRILRELHTLLRQSGAIKKVYWALTKGRWTSPELVVDIPLLKDYREGGRHVVRVNHHEGKESKTVFEILKTYTTASLVQATLKTGRTHQIRVHAAHRQHPIAGDDRYGDPTFNKLMKESGLKRLFLHAQSLSFVIPSSNEHIEVEAPLDQSLNDVLQTLTD